MVAFRCLAGAAGKAPEVMCFSEATIFIQSSAVVDHRVLFTLDTAFLRISNVYIADIISEVRITDYLFKKHRFMLTSSPTTTSSSPHTEKPLSTHFSSSGHLVIEGVDYSSFQVLGIDELQSNKRRSVSKAQRRRTAARHRTLSRTVSIRHPSQLIGDTETAKRLRRGVGSGNLSACDLYASSTVPLTAENLSEIATELQHLFEQCCKRKSTKCTPTPTVDVVEVTRRSFKYTGTDSTLTRFGDMDYSAESFTLDVSPCLSAICDEETESTQTVETLVNMLGSLKLNMPLNTDDFQMSTENGSGITVIQLIGLLNGCFLETIVQQLRDHDKLDWAAVHFGSCRETVMMTQSSYNDKRPSTTNVIYAMSCTKAAASSSASDIGSPRNHVWINF
eukprot:Lankesteria_metandrocarpae@DN4823_c0_g1_i1.p1